MDSLVEPPSAEVAATSTEFVPGCRLTVAENAPEESAVTVVMDVEGALAPGADPVTAMSTVAPASVVPAIACDAASTVALGRVRFAGTLPPATVSGVVTFSAAVAGAPLAPS